MSEPDAVPLPREGEVFFDVRGEARCMRLSWYADSAVAVFSIWQGNRCTGTFRLPFADLGRMARALQSGPGKPAVTDRPDHGHRDSLAGQHYSTGQHYGAGEGAGKRRAEAYPGDPYALTDHDPPDHGDAPWQASTQAYPAFPAEPRGDPRYLPEPGYPAEPRYQAGASYPRSTDRRGSYSAQADAGPDQGLRAASPVYAGHSTGRWGGPPAAPRAGSEAGGDERASGYPPEPGYPAPAAKSAADSRRAATGYPGH